MCGCYGYGSVFVMNIQTIVARELDPIEGAVVTVGSLKSGTQYNIISGKAVLEGTCRSYSEIVAQHLQDASEEERKQSLTAMVGM